MKKIAIVLVIAVIIGFVIYNKNPSSPSTAPETAVKEKTDREHLKTVADKTIAFTFKGDVQGEQTQESQAIGSSEKVTGKISMTLKAWNHFLLNQKDGMTKYEVFGETFQLEAQRGSVPLVLTDKSKMTMEIIDGTDPTKGDYFLLELSGLTEKNDPHKEVQIRLQLHDKSGQALKGSEVPKSLNLEQWNSQTLSLTSRSPKAEKKASENPDGSRNREERRKELRFRGKVSQLEIKVQ